LPGRKKLDMKCTFQHDFCNLRSEAETAKNLPILFCTTAKINTYSYVELEDLYIEIHDSQDS
jgi:hypothetical protein